MRRMNRGFAVILSALIMCKPPCHLPARLRKKRIRNPELTAQRVRLLKKRKRAVPVKPHRKLQPQT